LNLHFTKTEPKGHINALSTENQPDIQPVDECVGASSPNPHLSVKNEKKKQ
jgi:hypothetical protein